MAVSSTKPFVGVPADAVANFGGKQVLYVLWEQHLLFASPFLLCVDPATPLRDVLNTMVAPLIRFDPDAHAVDWNAVEWTKSRQPWQPDLDASLAANGIVHKEQLVFRTPGLNSLAAKAA